MLASLRSLAVAAGLAAFGLAAPAANADDHYGHGHGRGYGYGPPPAHLHYHNGHYHLHQPGRGFSPPIYVAPPVYRYAPPPVYQPGGFGFQYGSGPYGNSFRFGYSSGGYWR